MFPSYNAIPVFVNSTGRRLGGVDASFVSLNDKYGFKAYRNKERALACYMRQKWANRFNFAPAVGDFVNFIYQKLDFFGFVTEKLETASDYKDDVHKKLLTIWDNPSDERYMSYKHPLVQRLHELGFWEMMDHKRSTDNLDMHYQNVGIVDALTRHIWPIDFGWGCMPFGWTLDSSDIVAILKEHNITQQEFIRA